MNAYSYHCSLGTIYLVETDQKLSHLFFDNLPLNCEEYETPLLKKAHLELEEYFSGKRFSFTIPLYIDGTPFQKKVWDVLQSIPYGETLSYQDVAKRINHPKATRAVGNANHSNPLPLFIPCHRIIRSDGKLGGFGGGVDRKILLLSLEEKNKK